MGDAAAMPAAFKGAMNLAGLPAVVWRYCHVSIIKLHFKKQETALKSFTKIILSLSALLIQSVSTFAQTPKIESEDFFIPSKAPGIQLFMRYKHPAGVKASSPDKILLFVH